MAAVKKRYKLRLNSLDKIEELLQEITKQTYLLAYTTMMQQQKIEELKFL